MSRLWQTWVALWSHREVPTVLAVVRILAGLVLLWDVVWIGALGLTTELMGPVEAGGFGRGAQFDRAFLWQILPPTAEAASALWVVWVVSLAGVASGTLTPLSCFVAAVVSANQAALVPDADRGIDLLYRNVFWILALAPSGRALSIDAWWHTGSFWGDGTRHPAWGRHLLILQLIVMYTTAGIAKVGARWMPMADFSALWVILQDHAVTRFPPPPPTWMYPLTQIGTAVTMLWEWSSPLLLLLFWWRHRGSAAGPRAQRIVAARPEFLWLGIGAIFHLGIAVGLDLGIFPWAMLALYPVFLNPTDLARWLPVSVRDAEAPVSHPSS